MTAVIEARPTTGVTIAPLPERFLNRVRTEGVDDQGQPVRRLVAAGGEPCRDILRRARPGEELILASFTPFTKSGPYREFGPVFILAKDSGERPRLDRVPPAGASGNYLQSQFVIRAYSAEEEIVAAELVQAEDLEARVEELFEIPDTTFLHVRFPTYGCFACRIDRS